jgi:hypothetical protein
MAMLNADEIQMILIDHINGADQRVTGPAADAFLKKLVPEVVAIEKAGGTIDVPPEWEVDV